MDLSEDDTMSESESENSMLNDDDDKLSDDNLTGGGEQDNNMSFQDSAATQLGRSGSGSGLGGASLHGRDRGRNRDGEGGGDDDLDFLKRRARQLLHSQETHMEGGAGSGAGTGGASLMPKLDLAEPARAGGGRGGGRVHHRWDDHSSSPSSTGLGVRHSLPLLSTSQASGQ